jgi:hypothetical protein
LLTDISGACEAAMLTPLVVKDNNVEGQISYYNNIKSPCSLSREYSELGANYEKTI